MPTRAVAPQGAPCWIDLTTSDVEVARRFYCGVFGWVAEEADPEFGGYFMFTRDGVPVAGCMPAVPGGPADRWNTHLATDDAQRTLDSAVAHGGQALFGPHPVGDLGFQSRVVDPGGAAVGAWQPVNFQGFGVLLAPGAPCWHELHTGRYDEAVAFYRDVFGWTTVTVSDTPEFRYTTMAHGDGFLAGILDAGADPTPSQWVLYLGAEPDQACATVVELGGHVTEAPKDTPHGRMASVTDPNGTPFRVMKGNVEDLPDTM